MTTHKCLEPLLAEVAKKLDWPNYEVSSNINRESGNGFTGDFFLVSITNKDTKQKMDLAVKKLSDSAAKSDEYNFWKMYNTEIHFYEKVLPTLLKFKESRNVRDPLDVFPEFLLSWQNGNENYVVMKNLKLEGFDIIGRENFLDADHVEFIFRTYGKFHALSFAFKDQKPEEYLKLTQDIYDALGVLAQTELFVKSIENISKSTFEYVNEEIRRECREFFENTRRVFDESLRYKGRYSCLVHGDCWSNNMMFKCEGSKVVNVKLIDFQLVKNDTPVHDLSYFLYAGGTKENFDNLDKYLCLYYEDFSKMCKDLGSDPNRVYPIEALKEDWKKYSKWGFIMGAMVIKMKNSEESELQNMAQQDSFDGFVEMKINSKKMDDYKQKLRDLVEHVYRNGFLLYK